MLSLFLKALILLGLYDGDDGARTRGLSVTAERKLVNYWNQGERMAPFSALRNP
jgi:hypothetical protein